MSVQGNKFRWLEQPSQISIRTLQSVELTASWMISPEPMKGGHAAELEVKDGYLLCMQRNDIPPTQHWIDGRSVMRPAIHRGQSLIADLNHQHTAIIQSAIDCVSFYVSRDALDRFHDEHGLPRIPSLRTSSEIGQDDRIIEHLGECMLPVLKQPQSGSKLFIDYVALALLSHLTERYAETRAGRNQNGRLAPWQERRAKELLVANLSGKVGLHELAEACGLSRAHFARAFRTSTGTTPMLWLLTQRLERAKNLLLNSELSIEDIARHCGFVDQSHFTRAFTKHLGTTPGAWRRDRRL
ncbi:AraC family transcriptional regulator [Microvirga sp. VF16]|uniref:AraC family transcriptional regulator n=1 Tax=Microvirga sp. VF16 TaxID=2807101 RepID=UPI00193D9B59|nr:AraC family transcriptional regulator [Microvirga sp. VF16]QRM31441.1 helix-turn-helix transcriptional regulator [Microvirga sp. VF16]